MANYSIRYAIPFVLVLLFFSDLHAQENKHQRAITSDEYNKAKTYIVKDLDKDTYVKFDNAYILDRYEMRKPYFITGDDGIKKRIDLYRLIARDSLQDLGTVIFYTTEKGKTYTAVQPNFIAPANVWRNYFEDIHAIDRAEPNFILKLSYVLSKEMSFQLYKALNGGNSTDESATYGTDICFPGNELVTMADGKSKELASVVPGDKIITYNVASKKQEINEIKKLVTHEAKNYAVTQLYLQSAKEITRNNVHYVSLNNKNISATPNHPVMSSGKTKTIGAVVIGDELTCYDEKTKTYHGFTVINKIERGQGLQRVYNIEVKSGSTLLINGVMVNQK